MGTTAGNARESRWRRSAVPLLGAVAGGLLLAGCASGQPGRPQSVEELFANALEHSRVRHEDTAERVLREADSEADSDAGEARFYGPQPMAGPAEVPPRSNEPPPLSLVADSSGPRVSDVFVDTDLRQALAALAGDADISLTLDERVQGVANGVIDDEPFEAALQKLLLPHGFVYRRQDERAYLVGVADPESSLFAHLAERREYRPRHLPPEELEELMPGRFGMFLRVNDRHNLIIVEAPPAIARSILWELERNDQPVPQVVLEAIVCVFAPESRFRFGLDFEQGLDIGGGDFAELAMQNLNLRTLVGPADLETIRSFRFTSVFLRALAEEGYLAIRAAPRVMARSDEKAEISIARETFFGVQPEAFDARFIRQEIREVESGIMLDIRPVVRGSNIVVHIERAEVSEDLRMDNGNNGQEDRFPIINRRRVSTTVDLEDGQTIVIGGLVQRRQVNQNGRVPLLGDIPGLGVAFQRIDRQEEQAEVAIFISARIVGGPRRE